MKKHLYPVIFLLLIIHFGCSHKHDPKLQEAFDLHKKSMDVAGNAQELLTKIPDGEIRLKFETKLKEWNENLIEVPGFEHDHNHNHGHHHHHHHGTDLELTPADMLLVQKEFLDSIRSIQQRLLNLEKGKYKSEN